MMQSGSRTFAAQIALAAAFGGALAWKSMRLRQHTPAVREPRSADHGDVTPAPYHNADGPRRAPDPAQMVSRIDIVPWPAIGMLILGTLAVVVVIVAFVISLSRSHNEPTNVVVPPTVAVAATPTPPAAPTPTLAQTLEDARRALDLASIGKALDGYAMYFGKFPSTGGAYQTLCAQPTDAGCTVNRYARNLPLSDGTYSYWYASDGRSYTLLARVSVPPSSDGCPAGLPDTLRDTPVYCLTGAVPTP